MFQIRKRRGIFALISHISFISEQLKISPVIKNHLNLAFPVCSSSYLMSPRKKLCQGHKTGRNVRRYFNKRYCRECSLFLNFAWSDEPL